MEDVMQKVLNLKISKPFPEFATEVKQANSGAIILEGGESSFPPNVSSIQNTLKNISSSNLKSKITISDSSNIHLGDKINYNGSLYLNLLNTNSNTGISLIDNDNNKTVLIEKPSRIQVSDLPIVRKCFWSIRKPIEQYDKIEEPIKIVIISHTATTSSTDQSKNIQLIRDIQAFHVDTHNWNDIGYNFLIGCDGMIYEGRGWGVEGAHTFGYNNRSVGVSFIGCFINRMPTEEALNSCRNLLERGIKDGHLSKSYKLLGHRQCSETESPGSKLYEEITKWGHYYNKTIDEDI